MTPGDLGSPGPAVRPWTIVAYLCGDNPSLAAHVARQKDAILRFGGSDHFHVAVQWDLEEHGSERAVLDAARGWKAENIGRVNTGQPERFLDFLRWALDRCPAERVIVVMSGTGLLDKRASVGAPETDLSHLFTVCDDASAGDALSLSELGRMFRQAAVTSARERIDILALDLREIQCLEVAYELEGAVDFLIGPQTRVPDSGWNFEVVLQALNDTLAQADPAAPPGAADVATLLVQTAGKAYQSEHHGHLSLSAIDLQTLKNFASAFDTLSLAMMHSVGDELVWEARAAVARKLKPGDPTVTPKWPTPPPSAPAPAAEVDVEEEYLYDLFELLTELQAQLNEVKRSGLLRMVREHLDALDAAAFKRALESVDAACSNRGSGAPFPSLRDRAAAGSRVRALLEPSAGGTDVRLADFKSRVRGGHRVVHGSGPQDRGIPFVARPMARRGDRRTGTCDAIGLQGGAAPAAAAGRTRRHDPARADAARQGTGRRDRHADPAARDRSFQQRRNPPRRCVALPASKPRSADQLRLPGAAVQPEDSLDRAAGGDQPDRQSSAGALAHPQLAARDGGQQHALPDHRPHHRSGVGDLGVPRSVRRARADEGLRAVARAGYRPERPRTERPPSR